MRRDGPTAEQVIGYRQYVQWGQGWTEPVAKRWCAAALHTSVRAWEQWENGDRQMHPTFYELLERKVVEL